jgi:hypothetical protein
LSISIISACLVPARGVGFSAAAAFSGLVDFALAFPLGGVAAASASVAGAAASVAWTPAAADVAPLSPGVAPSGASCSVSTPMA